MALASPPGCTVGTLTAKATSSGAHIFQNGPHTCSWVLPTSGALASCSLLPGCHPTCRSPSSGPGVWGRGRRCAPHTPTQRTQGGPGSGETEAPGGGGQPLPQPLGPFLGPWPGARPATCV